MKKAQVTVFIILMLLILIVFGFMFYLMYQASQSESKTQKQISTEEIIARTNVEQGTEACLNEAAKTALNLLGQQGGWIYKNQIINSPYGPITIGDANDLEPNSNTIERGGEKYTVWITKKDLVPYAGKQDSDFNSPQSKIFKPNLYPCLSVNTISSNPTTQVTLDNTATTDCDETYTINQPMPSFAKLINFPKLCSRNQSVCAPCEVECENSIQHRLEKATTKYFEKCFENLEFPEYDILIGETNLKSLFTETTVDFEMKPQLNISSKDQVFDLELSTIRSRKFQVKFKSLIEMLDAMRNRELEIASYNLSKEIQEYKKGVLERPWVQDPTIEQTTPQNYLGKYYNIFTIILDEGDANIDGKPYKFTFVRENRGPVLQYIHSREYKKSDHPTAKIPVTLCAADPDEDALTYDISLAPPVASDGTTPITYTIEPCTTIDCSCLYIQTILNDFNSGRVFTLRVDVKDPVNNFDPLMNHTDWQQGIKLQLTT